MIRPTLLISVPRIYERVYNKIQAGLAEKPPLARKLFELAVNVGWDRFEYRQGRGGWKPSILLWPLLNKLVAGKIMAKLGGRMRIAASGGAPLPPAVAKVFIGLGLNLVKHIVETIHGGKMTLVSEEGKGSTFGMILPLTT